MKTLLKPLISVLVMVLLASVMSLRLAAQSVYVNSCAIWPGNGSPFFPFNTVTHAVAASAPGSALIVQGGSYPETLTIQKKLTLTAVAGAVLIGGQFVGTEEICVPVTARQAFFDDGRLVNCANAPPGVHAKLYFPAAGPDGARVVCGGPFPLVVYAHGRRLDSDRLCGWSSPGPLYQDYRQADGILSRLASSGMIVISVDLTWGLFEDAKSEIILNTIAFARDENGRTGSRLEQAVDLTKVGLAGHSTGGLAAILAARCLADQSGCLPSLHLGGIRVAALGLLAPGLNGPDEIRGAGSPALVIYGSNDSIQVGFAPLDVYRFATTPKHLVFVNGANHFGYTDEICLDPSDGRDSSSEVGGVTGREAQYRQQRTGRNYLEAFFSYYLLGDTGKLDYLLQQSGQQCGNPGNPPTCGAPRRRFDDLDGLNVGVGVCSCIP